MISLCFFPSTLCCIFQCHPNMLVKKLQLRCQNVFPRDCSLKKRHIYRLKFIPTCFANRVFLFNLVRKNNYQLLSGCYIKSIIATSKQNNSILFHAKHAAHSCERFIKLGRVHADIHYSYFKLLFCNSYY